jgi:hypothetical protein
MVDRYLGELDAAQSVDDADEGAAGPPQHVGPGIAA